MRLGAQVSAAGGVFNGYQRAADVGCETFMVYTKSNRQWAAKPLDKKTIAKFGATAAEFPDIHPVVVHAAYLINVASPDDTIRPKSIDALRDEVERAEALGVTLMVLHPGSHMEEGVDAGTARIVDALQQVIDDTPGYGVRICLELMAGQGTNLGYTFEQLGTMLTDTDRPSRMGVCFDTCHAFAAGYDFRSAESYAAMIDQLDRAVGLEQVKCFHFNDSKYELGSKRDRHQHIGQGFIGTEGFAHFVNDARWADHPAHLETPKTEKDDDGNEIEMDPVNLATLRSLVTER
jgi:deoxyribonuclease-4